MPKYMKLLNKCSSYHVFTKTEDLSICWLDEIEKLRFVFIMRKFLFWYKTRHGSNAMAIAPSKQKVA